MIDTGSRGMKSDRDDFIAEILSSNNSPSSVGTPYMVERRRDHTRMFFIPRKRLARVRIDFPVGYWFTEIKSHGDDLMVEICRGELTKSHRDGLIG